MKIALVNDMLMAVEAMRRIITSGGEHKICWIAADGAEALERCSADTPDLILMDLIMPRMDGVEATRRIMAATPCAIVIVTADVDRNSPKVFEAMGAGALDAVDTPVMGQQNGSNGARALLAKIETIRKLIGADAARDSSTPAPRAAAAIMMPPLDLVAIGASAGGPAALARILSQLDAKFSAAMVIVQHVDSQFAEGLASWLNSQSALPVRVAREGDRPEAGTVLLAGQENHLVFTSPSRLSYTQDPVDCSYRPSIDVFFRSADRFWRDRLIGVLLTGMGRDGAEGLRILKNHGNLTIAQDRKTSAVYGMPGAAVELDAAGQVLALERIGPRLMEIVARTDRTHV